MIKLPREVVLELEKKLTDLLEKQENSFTKNEVIDITQKNELYKQKITEKELAIKTLENEIRELQERIVPAPLVGEDYDEEIDNITQMLVLSGHYKEVVKPDGVYLEKTDTYNEEEVAVTVQDIEETEEEITETETTEIEEVIEGEEK